MKKKEKPQLAKTDIATLKTIDIPKMEKKVKEYYKESIILNNSDLKKKQEEVVSFSGSGFSTYTEPLYTYEDFVIDLFKLKNIISKLK